MLHRLRIVLQAVSSTDRSGSWWLQIGGGALALIAGLAALAGLLWDLL